MLPIGPLQVCETCRGFFCSQGDNELAALDLGSEILLQEYLDGVAGRQAPHTAIGLDERNAAVADTDEEGALRLLDLLEGAVGAELDDWTDLFVGLERDALLRGHGGGDAVVVVDDLGAEGDIVDELHRIKRIRRFLKPSTQCDLSLLKAERDFRIPAGNISCVRRVIDRAVAALLIVRLREADHVGGRRDIDEKCRGKGRCEAMLTREQYKELKRYEDSEIPIGDEGLSEIEEYLLKCGYIEASRMDVQSCPGIVQFYDSAYQITELGRQALSEYRHERYGKAFQVFLVLLGAAVALLADILLSLFC